MLFQKSKLQIAFLLLTLLLTSHTVLSSRAQEQSADLGADWIVEQSSNVAEEKQAQGESLEEDPKLTYSKALSSARQKLFEAYFDVKTQLKNQEIQGKELSAEKSKTESQIERLKASLDKLDESLQGLEAEIKKLEQRIKRQSNEIILTSKVIRKKTEQADKLVETLQKITKELYLKSQDTTLDVLLDSDTFSEALGNLETLNLLEGEGRALYVELQDVERDLGQRKLQQKERKTRFEELKEELKQKQAELYSLEASKVTLLENLHEEADNYESELQILEGENQFINDKAKALYESLSSLGLSEKLRKLEAEFGAKYESFGKAPLIWPVDPSYKGISAFFEDPGYLRVFGFAHKAIDIPEPTGTEIRAVADGYVYKAQDPEDASYNAIFLLHSNSLMTVYGHVEKVFVSEGSLVRQGDIIGLTGGAPGSLGAGRYTTGPHLHFEVRETGQPQNPLKYLP